MNDPRTDNYEFFNFLPINKIYQLIQLNIEFDYIIFQNVKIIY